MIILLFQLVFVYGVVMPRFVSVKIYKTSLCMMSVIAHFEGLFCGRETEHFKISRKNTAEINSFQYQTAQKVKVDFMTCF